MRYKIKADRSGYAIIEADSEEEAMEIAEEMDEKDFKWDDIDYMEIMYEML